MVKAEHELVTYPEENLAQGHHPFVQDGRADKDSRDKATAWIIRHLPPGGN